MRCSRAQFCFRLAVLVLPVLLTAAGSARAADGTDSPQKAGTLIVQLTGMTSDEGTVVYAMWSGPEHWLADNALREGRVPIENGTGTIELSDLPYGEYAVSVFHDRNDNKKLDTGLFRIPKEPIGTSNDPKIRFGPPKYEDAVFILNQPSLTITIPVKKVF